MIASLNPFAEIITGEASPIDVRRLAVAPSQTDWLSPQKLFESNLSEAVHLARAHQENSESKAGGLAAEAASVYRGPCSDGGLRTDLIIPG